MSCSVIIHVACMTIPTRRAASPKKESLWREDLQSGGTPRKTTPTGLEPKELATVPKISGIIDPHQ